MGLEVGAVATGSGSSLTGTCGVTGPELMGGPCAGAMLHCRHVIVTVPLLMLQRGCISFQPPLPPAKIGAISRIKMSNAVKVGLSHR